MAVRPRKARSLETIRERGHEHGYLLDRHGRRGTTASACAAAVNVAGPTDVQLLAEVQRFAPEGVCVPEALAVLDEASAMFPKVVDAGREGVEGPVKGWPG